MNNSYKLNERSTIGGMSIGQWLTVIPAFALAYLLLKYVPVSANVKLFCATMGLGVWGIAVYIAGYLELNPLRFAHRMLRWARSDERYLPGCAQAPAGLVVSAPERERREPFSYTAISMGDLHTLADAVSDGHANGHPMVNGHSARVASALAGSATETMTEEG